VREVYKLSMDALESSFETDALEAALSGSAWYR
jgi:hypothetical protein